MVKASFGYKMKIYRNRQEAGQALALALKDLSLGQDSIVFALPRGGVPVANEIAKEFHLPLDLMVVRKIGSPLHSEYAIGAIAANDVIVLNQAAIDRLGQYKTEINTIIEAEKKELLRREKVYRRSSSYPDLTGKTVILVDDGIATGFTMKAAIMSIKTLNPSLIILAVPVASKESIHELKQLVDFCLCPLIPSEFYAVGEWYQEFNQTSDQEVIKLLKQNKTFAPF
jgi:putative phosphoribosyl transferase